MGFISSANTVSITAKLTLAGRQRLLTQSNQILTHFVIGDSDANYQTSGILSSGLVPSNSGDLGENGGVNDNIDVGVGIKNKLYLSNTQITIKSVESGSNVITNTTIPLGETVVSGNNLTYTVIDKNDKTSSFTNYFESLRLPILESKKNLFTGTTSTRGGWLDTAFSGLATNKVLMVVANNDSYGELIDGKTIKTTLPIVTGYTSGGEATGITTYDCYSTFVNSGQYSLVQLDARYKDGSVFTNGLFGTDFPVSYMVSDNVQRPNNDSDKSWATGYDEFKPFSVNYKQLINTKTVAPTGINVDKVIGVAYLDKGILAFTDPTIVNNIAIDFTGDTETGTVTNDLGFYYYSGGTFNTTVDSVVNNLVQNVICIAGRGEFFRSTNPTIDINDEVRITEIGITDVTGEVLAIGKADRQIIKKKNDFVIFDVQVIL
jgi:hypothetical protein